MHERRRRGESGGSPVKKGPLFEKRVVQYLRENGFPGAERRVMGGKNDRGDVGGVPSVCLEIKNTISIQMGTAMKEAAVEAKNAGATVKAVVFNRRNHEIKQAYVLLELSDLVTLLSSYVPPSKE